MALDFSVGLEWWFFGEARRDHDAIEGRTVSRWILSSLCLGTTVTSSISHRNATSEGTSPGGRGKAMTRNHDRGSLVA